MNPILINPKIESNASVSEQIRQVKSYLRQFKEEVEIILSNIDSENMSKTYEESLISGVTNKVETSKAVSEISQTANSIRLSVKNMESAVSALEVSVNGIKSEVYDSSGNSKISQNAENIALKVSKDGVISAINQSAESVEIEASKIDLSGYATFSSLQGEGTTTINGANIKSGTISAERLDLSNCVTVTDLATSGATTINGSNITTGSIDAALITTGKIKADQIDTEGLEAESIQNPIDHRTMVSYPNIGQMQIGAWDTNWIKINALEVLISNADITSSSFSGTSVITSEFKFDDKTAEWTNLTFEDTSGRTVSGYFLTSGVTLT